MLLHDHWSADSTSFTWSTQIGIHDICVFLFVRYMFLNLAGSVPLFLVHLLIGVFIFIPGCLRVSGNVVVSSVYVFYFLRLCFGCPLLVNALWAMQFRIQVSDWESDPARCSLLLSDIVLVSWKDLTAVQHLGCICWEINRLFYHHYHQYLMVAIWRW